MLLFSAIISLQRARLANSVSLIRLSRASSLHFRQ